MKKSWNSFWLVLVTSLVIVGCGKTITHPTCEFTTNYGLSNKAKMNLQRKGWKLVKSAQGTGIPPINVKITTTSEETDFRLVVISKYAGVGDREVTKETKNIARYLHCSAEVVVTDLQNDMIFYTDNFSSKKPYHIGTRVTSDTLRRTKWSRVLLGGGTLSEWDGWSGRTQYELSFDEYACEKYFDSLAQQLADRLGTCTIDH